MARIGVIGGGRMGAGIAHVFAAAGCEVTVVEAGPEAQRTARDRIEKTLAQAAARSRLSDPVDQVLERIRLAGSPAELPGDAALVIEAVPELPGARPARVSTAGNARHRPPPGISYRMFGK